MPKASACHILVKTEQECQSLKEEIESEQIAFADAAKQHSFCPSGQQGGDLGTFSQGQMVPEFDRVVFRDALNQVHGPIKTQFGYHLIEITSRSD